MEREPVGFEWESPGTACAKTGAERNNQIAKPNNWIIKMGETIKLTSGNWRPQRDSNPRRRRERPVSWARLDDGDALISFVKKK